MYVRCEYKWMCQGMMDDRGMWCIPRVLNNRLKPPVHSSMLWLPYLSVKKQRFLNTGAYCLRLVFCFYPSRLWCSQCTVLFYWTGWGFQVHFLLSFLTLWLNLQDENTDLKPILLSKGPEPISPLTFIQN